MLQLNDVIAPTVGDELELSFILFLHEYIFDFDHSALCGSHLNACTDSIEELIMHILPAITPPYSQGHHLMLQPSQGKHHPGENLLSYLSVDTSSLLILGILRPLMGE